MSVNLIFKIAAVGILVSVISQVLKHSGREEQAFLTSLAGLILVLFWIVPYIYELFCLVFIILHLISYILFYHIFNITYFLHKLLNRTDLYILYPHILHRKFSISLQFIYSVCRFASYFIHIDAIDTSDSLFISRD